MWPLLFFCLFVCTNAWTTTTTTTTTTHPQIRTGAAPRHFSSCGHGTALFVANVEENDENMEITNAQELQRTLLNQNRPPQSLEKKTSSYRSSQKENGIDLETLEKLQAIAEQEEANQHRGQNDSDSDDDKQIKEKEEEDDDDDDFILLDGDEYLQSSQQMNPDGSLPELFLNSPQRRRRPQRGSVPEEMELIQQMAVNPNVASQYQSGDTEPTMQDLVEAMNNIQANNPEAQEALHSKVFENEQGYLQSSKLFQEGLMDPQKAQQAQAERRNRRYRQTMEKQSKELEAEIDEWQAILNQKLELEKQKRLQRQRQQQQSKENANTTKMKPIIEQLQERRRQEQQTFDEEMEEEWQQVLNQKLQKEQTLPQPQASSKSDAATSNSEATPPKQLQQTQSSSSSSSSSNLLDHNLRAKPQALIQAWG